MIFVRSQAKSILELNLLITQNGFSAVKNVGIFFLKKINILMEELENQKPRTHTELWLSPIG